MQRASTLATANYAETLGTIYLVGAPNFFSTVWGWIGRWFDPGTVEKIFILNDKEVLSTLSRFIDVKDIPRQFGGELDWSYGEPTGPRLGEEEKKVLGLAALPRGSLRWVDGKVVLKGTGRSEGEIRQNTPVREESVVDKREPERNVEETVVPTGVENGAVEGEQDGEEEDGDEVEVTTREEYTIEDAARENPSAPVKELAATLEGTTL
jgi:hypothetical protein